MGGGKSISRVKHGSSEISRIELACTSAFTNSDVGTSGLPRAPSAIQDCLSNCPGLEGDCPGLGPCGSGFGYATARARNWLRYSNYCSLTYTHTHTHTLAQDIVMLHVSTFSVSVDIARFLHFEAGIPGDLKLVAAIAPTDSSSDTIGLSEIVKFESVSSIVSRNP